MSLFLSLCLEAAVAAVPAGQVAETVTERGLGIAYVPPTPELRQLVGSAWVPLADARKWLLAISAAVQLVGLADYPPRNDIYQIMTLPSVGKLIRRIEEVGNGQKLGPNYLPQLRALREVIG